MYFVSPCGILLMSVSLCVCPDRGEKAPKKKVKIPWDVLAVYSEHLPDELDDTETNEEMKGYEASAPRLKVRRSFPLRGKEGS